MLTKAQIESIPRIPQRQDSIVDQLIDLMKAANRLGMWDAADWIGRFIHGEDAKCVAKEMYRRHRETVT